MTNKDTDYIKSKINHMKNVLKMQAGVNPTTGAAQPDWAKAEADYRTKNHVRIVKRRLAREKAFIQDEWSDR